jgi:hypothetical protein
MSKETKTESKPRPEIVTDDMLEYLDSLRESGATNMFGARPYVQRLFSLSKSDAGTVLSYWMQTFGKDDR